MRKSVKVLSGISGSGKSTYANKLITTARESSDNVYAAIVSADSYFMSDGVYQFNPMKLGEAHAACFRQFITCMQTGEDILVVDNTNTTTAEVSPYILGADAFGYEVEIVTFLPTLTHTFNASEAYIQKCLERSTHGISREGLKAQWNALGERKLMPWWNNTTVYENMDAPLVGASVI